MRIMVLESEPGVATSAITELQNAGHQIRRCHDTGASSFPCNALRDDRTCPLDDGCDVALVCHGSGLGPARTEDGVSCAVRNAVPVAVTTLGADNPFAGFARLIDHDDLVAEVEHTASEPLDRHSRLATEACREIPAVAASGAYAAVSVTRRSGRLRAEVTVTAGCPASDELLATTVHGALRDGAPAAAGVDVAVLRV